MDPSWNRAIGCGLPLALGSKLACPERPIISVVGDAGLGLSGRDLEAAFRCGIGAILIVANNNGINGGVRQKLLFAEGYPNRFAQLLPDIRYDEIAWWLGGHSAWITELGEVGPALNGALQSGLPACLDVRVNLTAPQPGIW